MEQPATLIANNLQTLRESRNLSLDGLAEITGVSKSMLRQIEIGKSSSHNPMKPIFLRWIQTLFFPESPMRETLINMSLC